MVKLLALVILLAPTVIKVKNNETCLLFITVHCQKISQVVKKIGIKKEKVKAF